MLVITEKQDCQPTLNLQRTQQLVSNITWQTSIKALLYKSVKVQQRSMWTNTCQIISPLLCIIFTVVVKLISQENITTKVNIPTFPRPFDLPMIYQILPFNLTCKQLYLYNYNGPQHQKQLLKTLLSKNLKRYCQQTKQFSPIFIEKQKMNQYMMDLLNQVEKQTYQLGIDMLAAIPDGTFQFHRVNSTHLDVTVSVNDYWLSQYHRNNGVTKLSTTDRITATVSYVMTTQGFMTVMQKVTRPFLQLSHPKQIIFGSYLYMPFDGKDTALIDKSINVMGSGLYPLGLSMMLPLFLYTIVSQKQDKLIEIMRMNGLKLKYYWICTFIFNFFMSMTTFSVFYIFGRYILQLFFFTATSSTFMWTLLVGWAIAQISMTNFFQIFLKNSKSASIIGYILSIFSTLVGQTISMGVYPDPLKMPIIFLFYPPFALCRIIYIMGIACSSTGCYNSFADLNQEATHIIFILYGWIIVFPFSIWLHDKIQQEYGVAQRISISIPICKFWKWFRYKLCYQHKLVKQSTEIQIQIKTIPTQTNSKIDKSVQQMKNQVKSLQNFNKNLIIHQLSKKYLTSNGRQDYIALKPLTLMIEDKQIFGLLGPNGAGKTTLISVLTGMYPKTSGNAWINGIQVSTGEVNQYIGVCPQFDLLWNQLTVYEHLKFYAMLKGVQNSIIDQKIQQSLFDVDLHQLKNTVSSQLSGGMQRRLSIAIALVGNPSVVFLDQPSSGLDPSHRHRLWDILLKCKKKTSIVLTTHLMQQAQNLCDRIGLICKGELRCIGKTSQLKQSFGQGYRLHINFLDLLNPQNNKLIKNLQQKYHAKIVNQLDSRVILKVDKNMVLDCVRQIRTVHNTNWMVSQPSLYDVFMSFVQ